MQFHQLWHSIDGSSGRAEEFANLAVIQRSYLGCYSDQATYPAGHYTRKMGNESVLWGVDGLNWSQVDDPSWVALIIGRKGGEQRTEPS